MAILYISLIINLTFVFNWLFILFLGLQQCSISHSQIYNFLIVWLRLLIYCMYIHPFEFTVRSYFFPETLTFYPKVKLLIVILKYSILFITFFSFGLDCNFWHVTRLNQDNLPYAIICDLDLLLQDQVIYNLKRKYYMSWHASPGTPVFSTNKTYRHDILKYYWKWR